MECNKSILNWSLEVFSCKIYLQIGSDWKSNKKNRVNNNNKKKVKHNKNGADCVKNNSDAD